MGDALHALSCAAGYNIRWLMRAISRLGLRGLLLALSAVLLWTLGMLMAVLTNPRAPRSCGRPQPVAGTPPARLLLAAVD